MKEAYGDKTLDKCNNCEKRKKLETNREQRAHLGFKWIIKVKKQKYLSIPELGIHRTIPLKTYKKGAPQWLSGKESTCQCRRHGFDPWFRKMPWRRKWQLIPLFLPGKSHGQRRLPGCSPWGHKESDTT